MREVGSRGRTWEYGLIPDSGLKTGALKVGPDWPRHSMPRELRNFGPFMRPSLAGSYLDKNRDLNKHLKKPPTNLTLK